MKIYLKGYYGYQNFGDELFFFELVRTIFAEYPQLQQLTVEVGNKSWMNSRVQRNLDFIQEYYQEQREDWTNPVDREKVQFFEVPQNKWLRYLKTSLGISPHARDFKIFWGGEVLDESRNFPHDGWNLLLLYPRSIWKKNFALYGGIGSSQKKTSKILKKLLLPRAQKMYLRDNKSFQEAKEYHQKSFATTDFSKPLLDYFLTQQSTKKSANSRMVINLNPEYLQNPDAIKAIINNPDQEVYFFPGDLGVDLQFFPSLQEQFTQAKIYDWSQQNIPEILQFLAESEKGIGYRLHFLYPLKQFWVPFQNLSQHSKNQSLF